MDNLQELRDWIGRFPKGGDFPTAKLRDWLQLLADELAYLRFLVWKLSVRELALQHPKYEHNLQRTYVSSRAADFGIDDVKPGAGWDHGRE